MVSIEIKLQREGKGAFLVEAGEFVTKPALHFLGSLPSAGRRATHHQGLDPEQLSPNLFYNINRVRQYIEKCDQFRQYAKGCICSHLL